MRYIITLLIISFFISCKSSSNKKETSQNDSLQNEMEKVISDEEILKTPFAIAFEDNNTIMLLGKYELDKPVVLIDNKTGICFETNTKSYIVGMHVEYEVRTSLMNQPTKKHDRYIAYFGAKPKDYHTVPFENVTESTKIKYIDSLICNTKYKDTLIFVKDIYYPEIKTKPPKVVRLKVGEKDVFIATYYYEDIVGPRFAIQNQNIISLNRYDFCSDEELYAFYMNKDLFIQTRTIGCGCGTIGLQIFKITNESIDEYYEDFGMSD